MRIKRYKLFLENQRSKEDINSICQKYNIRNYTINDDGTVDVDGNVRLYRKGLTELPLKFGRITGKFSCEFNQLTSLEGSPKWVGKDFNCGNNEIKSLEGGPEFVGGDYYSHTNNLVNFKGFPEDFEGFSNFTSNPVYYIIVNIPEEKRNKFIYWCNEYNSIDDKGDINDEWMEEVYYRIGLDYTKKNVAVSDLSGQIIRDYWSSYRDQSIEDLPGYLEESLMKFESLGMTADEINSICKKYGIESHDINFICKKYGIKNYTINDDGTVDVDGDVNLRYRSLTKLPLKFGKVTGFFNCSKNQLTILEGSPYWVGRYFDCSNNELTTLEDGPKTVIGSYYCQRNKLVNFKGWPEDFDGYLFISGNPVYKLLENITNDKRNKFIYWCNEFDAIDDQGKVITERMEEVYNQIGLEFK